MRLSRLVAFAMSVFMICLGLTGCAAEKKPDFSGYSRIAELGTLECRFHNVAEIYNDGTNVLFGINIGYKKAWFEYEGSLTLGVDVSKVRVDGPDENGVVTIAIPQAQVLGVPDADETTFSDIYSDTGLLTPITSVDQSEAYNAAQTNMKETAENDAQLMGSARERAKSLLGAYVHRVGEKLGKNYELKFVDAE